MSCAYTSDSYSTTGNIGNASIVNPTKLFNKGQKYPGAPTTSGTRASPTPAG
ncbi:hypothetical protein [Streptomyces sp. H34-S4]|uniref:hypothetical protein n=1 Tax=Streptomyces sp. H34-S4 TaxID=2996463 RepID=UPI00226FC586|nr:hypothetical protein [Streptomyces sp. H34-S4]MCY0939510.1 hypothetical protein [Streptomyces sp. H34-S4]